MLGVIAGKDSHLWTRMGNREIRGVRFVEKNIIFI